MQIEQIKVSALIPYARNSRTHSDAQVAKIVQSIREFGFVNPVLIDGDDVLIAGHGRTLSAQQIGLVEVPAIRLTHLTDAQRRAFVIADNRIAEDAGWDDELLKAELEALTALDFDVAVVGFEDDELSKLLGASPSVGLTDPDEVPDVAEEVVTKTGDVWMLGAHRVMCGDSTSATDVSTLCAGVKAALIHADPPYGMGKEADGVVNDNIYGAQLDAFQMSWWRPFRAHASQNASAYIWGNSPDLWRLWYAGGLADSEPMSLRNEIVWDKKNIAGMASPDLTQYPEATERCLFFQLGRHIFKVNQTKEDYWPGWDPIRSFLVGEKEKAGFTAKRVNEICGNNMHGHWFGTSQWSFISQDNYAKLATAANGTAFTRPYDDLQDEYKRIQSVFNGEVRGPRFEEFAAARPYFDNAHSVMRDVWDFPRVVGAERFDHATPKPVSMMERVMRSSAREGDVVLEPFGGTGSTVMGAEKTGRICYAMEMQPKYVDVIVKRWQDHTGRQAIRERDRLTFSEAAALE